MGFQRTIACLSLLALAGCAVDPLEKTICDRHGGCFTYLEPGHDCFDPRRTFWREHSAAEPSKTQYAGAVVRDPLCERLGVAGVGAAGYLGGAQIIGDKIGPSGHAAPRTLTIRQEAAP